MADGVRTEADAIRDLADASVSLNSDLDIPFTIVPQGYQVEAAERFLNSPSRTRTFVALGDAESMIAYLNRFKGPQTQLYADEEALVYHSIIDDDGPTVPSWRTHRVELKLTLSPEWARWVSSDGKLKPQADFAMFIEENLPDIVAPDGATLLEVSKNLSAQREVSFKSGVRLQSGDVEFTYVEATQASTKGQLRVPDTFTIGIPVVVGGDLFKIEARLAYRINPTGLTLGYNLIRAHKVKETVFSETRKKIADATGVLTYRGRIK